MILVKVNGTDYVNPEMVIYIKNEKDKDNSGKELQSKSWVIYTAAGHIKTNSRFNVREFVRKSK